MAVSKVRKKIYLILSYLQPKLHLNLDIIVKPFTEEEKEKYPKANFLVGPTERGREDIDAFAIHVHRRVDVMDDFELFSSVLHELIHAVYWSVADSHATALREVRSKAMKAHLADEMYDSREQGTYKLERAIAPILYPDFLDYCVQKGLDLKSNNPNIPSSPKGPEGVTDGLQERRQQGDLPAGTQQKWPR